MRIFLLGFMAAGKTTIGKKLAQKLNFNFFDLDFYIEKKHKATISYIFNLVGEEGFRLIEHRTLLEILNYDNYILSTGGGTPCFYNNISKIRNHGLSIYLKISANLLVKRLKKSKRKRPLVNNFSEKELTNFVSKQILLREKYYLKADLVFEAEKYKFKNLVNLIYENIN